MRAFLKPTVATFVLILLASATAVARVPDSNPTAGSVRLLSNILAIQAIEGDVSVRSSRYLFPTDAKTGEVLREGDALVTQSDGRAELGLGGSSFLWLDRETYVRVESYEDGPGAPTRMGLKLTRGTIILDLSGPSAPHLYVEAPDARVEPQSGASVRIEAPFTVVARRGAVLVSAGNMGEAADVLIEAGTDHALWSDGVFGANPGNDSFDLWADARYAEFSNRWAKRQAENDQAQAEADAYAQAYDNYGDDEYYEEDDYYDEPVVVTRYIVERDYPYVYGSLWWDWWTPIGVWWSPFWWGWDHYHPVYSGYYWGAYNPFYFHWAWWHPVGHFPWWYWDDYWWYNPYHYHHYGNDYYRDHHGGGGHGRGDIPAWAAARRAEEPAVRANSRGSTSRGMTSSGGAAPGLSTAQEWPESNSSARTSSPNRQSQGVSAQAPDVPDQDWRARRFSSPGASLNRGAVSRSRNFTARDATPTYSGRGRDVPSRSYQRPESSRSRMTSPQSEGRYTRPRSTQPSYRSNRSTQPSRTYRGTSPSSRSPRTQQMTRPSSRSSSPGSRTGVRGSSTRPSSPSTAPKSSVRGKSSSRSRSTVAPSRSGSSRSGSAARSRPSAPAGRSSGGPKGKR